MLEFASAFRGYSLEANDGEIGAIIDFLFDGRTSAVRWLVVHAGGLRINRKIWLHPAAIAKADHERCVLSVSLTKAQVRILLEFSRYQSAPASMERLPRHDEGSRPRQTRSVSAANPFASLTRPLFVLAPDPETAANRIDGEPHLHSVAEITRLHVVGSDGAIGKVEDLLIDEVSWSFPYVVVETGAWWSGNHVLISRHAMTEISGAERQLRVDLNREQIKTGPSWSALSDVIKIDTNIPGLEGGLSLSPAGNAAEPGVSPMDSLVYVADRPATMG